MTDLANVCRGAKNANIAHQRSTPRSRELQRSPFRGTDSSRKSRLRYVLEPSKLNRAVSRRRRPRWRRRPIAKYLLEFVSIDGRRFGFPFDYAALVVLVVADHLVNLLLGEELHHPLLNNARLNLQNARHLC